MPCFSRNPYFTGTVWEIRENKTKYGYGISRKVRDTGKSTCWTIDWLLAWLIDWFEFEFELKAIESRVLCRKVIKKVELVNSNGQNAGTEKHGIRGLTELYDTGKYGVFNVTEYGVLATGKDWLGHRKGFRYFYGFTEKVVETRSNHFLHGDKIKG